MVCMCLYVYVMANICCVCIDLIGLFCVLFCYCLVVFCFWCVLFVCGVLCCCVLVHWFVARVCALLLLCWFSLLFFCYDLNDFAVCDCILYVPSLRCSFLFCVMVFVCRCVYAMACMSLFIDVTGVFCVCCSDRFLSCSVILLSRVAFGVYVLFVVCCVAVCCFIGFVVRVCFVVAVLF